MNNITTVFDEAFERYSENQEIIEALKDVKLQLLINDEWTSLENFNMPQTKPVIKKTVTYMKQIIKKGKPIWKVFHHAKQSSFEEFWKEV